MNCEADQDENSRRKPGLLRRFVKQLTSKSTNVVPTVGCGGHEMPMNLADVEPKALAQEMTLIDSEMLCSIGLDEVVGGAWKSCDRVERSPHVVQMIDFYHSIAAITATEILAKERAHGRVQVIIKIIKIAEECAELNNFNSVKALLTGLRYESILRLSKTWRKVPHKTKSTLHHLSVLTSSVDDIALFYRHRRVCKQQDTKSIHFLGDILAQISYIESCLARTTEGRIHTAAPTLEAPHVKEDSTLSSPGRSITSWFLPKDNPSSAINPSSNTTGTEGKNPSRSNSGFSTDTPPVAGACAVSIPSSSIITPPQNHVAEGNDLDSVSTRETKNKDTPLVAGACAVSIPSSSIITPPQNHVAEGNDLDSVSTRETKNKEAPELDDLDRDGGPTHSILATGPAAEELWELLETYQSAAIGYTFSRRVGIREFLQNAVFNTGERNLELSYEREPPKTRN